MNQDMRQFTHTSLRPRATLQAEPGRNEVWPLHPHYFVNLHDCAYIHNNRYKRCIDILIVSPTLFYMVY